MADSELLPYCFILGLDFLIKNKLSLDFRNDLCRQDGKLLAPMINGDEGSGKAKILSCVKVSHVCRLQDNGGDFKFEIQGSPDTISGLSLLSEGEAINRMQNNCKS